MTFRTVGLMTPGDMGQAVAIRLIERGIRVCSALGERSERSRQLAREAGVVDVGTLETMMHEAEVVLSIMNPAAALEFAGQAAAAMRASRRAPLFVDCNAIAPATAQRIAATIGQAGGEFVDGGIIGPPPRAAARATLFVSGPQAAAIEALSAPAFAVRSIGERIGDASALKMCYGALNKGTQALWLHLLVAARRLGVHDVLEQQLQESLRPLHEWSLRQLPPMPPKAYRWVPEMEEIAKTLESVGVTPRLFEGAADVYRFVADTELGRETPEQRDRSRTGDDVLRLLADTEQLAPPDRR